MSRCRGTFQCSGVGFNLPVTTARRVCRILRAHRGAAGTTARGRRATLVRARRRMSIDVWVLVPATGRRPAGVVRVVRIAGAGRTVFVRWATTPIAVPITAVIEFTRWGPTAVVVPTRAISAGRTAAVVVVVVWGWGIRATSARGARAVPVTAPIIWSCAIGNARLEWRRRRWVADLGDTVNLLSLEFMAVQLLHGGLQVGIGLILNEAMECQYGED